MDNVATLDVKAERVRQLAWLLTDDLTVNRLLAYADELEARDRERIDGNALPA